MIFSLLFIICLIVYFATKFKGISNDETYEYLKEHKGEKYAREQVAYMIAKEQIKEEDKKKLKWQGITHWTWQHLIKKRAKEIANTENFEEIYVYGNKPIEESLEKTKSEVTVVITTNDGTVNQYGMNAFESGLLENNLLDGAQFIKVDDNIIPTNQIKAFTVLKN